MRERVLTLLRQHPHNFVSGEDISRALAVSRTAIWKHIQSLRQDGYVIDSHPKLGYALRGTPDRLLPEEIRWGLDTEVLGREIHYFPAISSTNNEAKQLAAAGCPEGTIVVADEQRQGRGRLARGWFSPPRGGIWLSVVLRPPFTPREAPKCTLMAAVAVARALRAETGLEVEIKWPNDIMYQGRKMVGILTELSAEMDAINFIVLGLGINANIPTDAFPSELAAIATSPQAELGRAISRIALLQRVLRELEAHYFLVRQQGFDPVLTLWRQLSCTLGRQVDCFAPDRTFSGVAVDIDCDGALIVQGDGFTERVVAGDVSVRNKAGLP